MKKSKDVIVKAFSDYYKESQVIRFQPWGNLGKNKPKESGNAGEVGSGGKTSSNAGNKSSDGAGTSSSSNGKKPNQTPSSSKKSQSSGETDATASSPGTGKKSGDGEGTNSPSSGKKTGQTPSTSKKSKSSGETDSTGSSSGIGKKPGDGEETGPSSSGKIEDPTPNTSKKTQTSGEPDTTGSNTGTGKKSSEGEGTNSSSTNKKNNQIPNSHNQWKQDSSKKKGKGKNDKKKKEEEQRKREEEERQKSESEAEGTGGIGKVDSPADDVIRDGSHIVDGKLKPNVTYKTGEYEYIYKTDSEGRLEKFTADDLKLTERGSRLPHDPVTPGKEPGDHAGHLAGDRFGGSPEIDNLVSQLSNVNLSQYKKIENQWANAIKEGKQVKVNVEVKYDGDSVRPSKFNVQYEIDGEVFSKSILN